jgi:hypothetical protein
MYTWCFCAHTLLYTVKAAITLSLALLHFGGPTVIVTLALLGPHSVIGTLALWRHSHVHSWRLLHILPFRLVTVYAVRAYGKHLPRIQCMMYYGLYKVYLVRSCTVHGVLRTVWCTLYDHVRCMVYWVCTDGVRCTIMYGVRTYGVRCTRAVMMS